MGVRPFFDGFEEAVGLDLPTAGSQILVLMSGSIHLTRTRSRHQVARTHFRASIGHVSSGTLSLCDSLRL